MNHVEQGDCMLAFISEFLKKYETPRWDMYPEFDVYMDQLLGRIGAPFDFGLECLEGAGSRELTAHMVNNYVKNGWLPHPQNRRYSRDHMARLYFYRMLKGVIPLSVVAQALDRLIKLQSARIVADTFAELQDKELSRIVSEIEARRVDPSQSDEELDYLALSLAARANALSLVSETIIRRHDTGFQPNP